jgi:hypothetical protein
VSIYTDLQTAVFAWTNRADLVTETDVAIRSAVRSAHKAGTFTRDLVSVPLTNVDISTQISAVDLVANAPNFRRLISVGPTGLDTRYDEVFAYNILDPEGFARLNVYWLLGQTLNIRASSPSATITLIYLRNWTTVPIASLDSWIAVDYIDLVAAAAAAQVLSGIGEQEIRQKVEKIAAEQLAQLIADCHVEG